MLEDRELSEGATVKDFLIVQTEGGRQVKRKTLAYNLPVTLAIGPICPDLFPLGKILLVCSRRMR